MGQGWTRREVLGAMAAGTACALAPRFAGAGSNPGVGSTGWLLRDVLLVDGSGAPGRRTDVVVRGDRIEYIGRPSPNVPGLQVVDGGGRVLAPGFIDLHTHGNPLVDSYASFLAMGVTTVLLGQDGASPSLPDAARNPDSLSSWMDAMTRTTTDVNVATVSGHGALRRRAGIDDGTRRPTEAELERLQVILEQDLQAGAFGMSTGLEYVPGRYAETRELASLGPVVARHDGVVMSHMRNEDVDAVRESILELVAASGPARAHVSHLKMVYGKGEAEAERLLGFMEQLRANGTRLTADAYPYEASYTGVEILFPEWALPPADYAAVLASRRDELRAYLQQRMERRGGPDALLFGTGPHTGKRLSRLVAEQGRAFAEILLDIGPGGGHAAHFVMDRALQERLLLDPKVALGSDGTPGGSHPRSAGTFSKFIEELVVKQQRLPIEEAVRKMTSLPAAIVGLAGRGTIRAGAKADLVLFDPARVRAKADYIDPTAKSEGFDLVLVNGEAALKGGEPVARAGTLLRRSRPQVHRPPTHGHLG